MIAKLYGLLDSFYDGFLILNVSGVGYRVFCSSRTLGKLPSAGEAVTLFIETQVREDHIHLFGFIDQAEKEWFNVLTNVQGVGAKVALAILSALSPNDLQMALSLGDAKAFTSASGVGPKLASRIVAELKGKTTLVGVSFDVAEKTGRSDVLSEAVSALVNLGYGRSDAGMIAASILKENDKIEVGELIRLSLKEIGRKNG